MNTILIVFKSDQLIRFTWYSEQESDIAWTEFKRELKAAKSDMEVRYMTEQEFLKLITK